MAEYNILKKFKPFIMGKCRCDCGIDIPIRSEHGYLRKFFRYHENIGINNSRYQGWKNNSDGRKMLNMPWHPNSDKKGYVYEHVLIMSQNIGRPLEKGEVIHHIDGDLNNNNITNLKLLQSQSKHRSIHKIDKSKRRCSNPLCSNPTKTLIDKQGYESWYDDNNGGYLCRKCYTKKNYKYNKKK